MFFKLEPDWRFTRKYGFTIENEGKLFAQGCTIFGPEPGRRGFPAYPEPPRLLIDPKRGRPPSDCDWYSGYWIISDKLKAVLDAVDPDGCAFVKWDVRHAGGKATDDRLAGGKYYSLTSFVSIVFKLDVVGSAHIFGPTFAAGTIFCDGELKNACQRAGIKGMTFQKCGAIYQAAVCS